MEIFHQQGEIIGDRYQIVTSLGFGSMATTYSAIDLSNSSQVALKVVSLRQARDWKVLELFEREAKVLANLNHPFIPNYLDYFCLDTGDKAASDRPHTRLSPDFANWLDKLLESDTSDRFNSAETASAVLKTLSAIDSTMPYKRNNSRILIEHHTDSLKIELQSRGIGSIKIDLLCISFPFLFIGGTLFLSAGGILPTLILLVGIAILSGWMISSWFAVCKTTTLYLGKQTFCLQRAVFNWRQGITFKRIEGFLQDIDWVGTNVDVRRTFSSKNKDNTCAISVAQSDRPKKVNKIDRLYKFGKGYELSLDEANEISQAVSNFLQQVCR